jgi:tetratricopeptide (TPR) repeat protein/uncharacterized membrane protein
MTIMTIKTANPNQACSDLARHLRPLLLAAILLCGSSWQASAQLQFCNEYAEPVRFAIAYETPEGWVSEGWIKVAPKDCADTKYDNLTEFYWTGETDWRDVGGGKRERTSWGKARQFSVTDKSFTLKNADQKLKGARRAGFSGPVTVNTPSSVVVAIQTEGGSMVVTTPIDTAKSDPDYKICEESSGDEALAACERAIASGKFIGHNLATLYLNRGVERGRNGDDDGELADFDEAIRIDPKFALAYKNRGKKLLAKGEYDAAIESFNAAIQLKPNDFVNYTRRGDAYRRKGEFELAAADYNKALSLNPPDKDKETIQANLNRLDPDFQTCQNSSGQEALASCNRAIDSGKFTGDLLAELYINRGVERMNKDDLDGAIEDYDAAIGLDGKSALAYANRGRVHFAKGDYDDAINDLTQAVELSPESAKDYAKRGDVYRRKGDREHAIADYNKALSLKPDDKTKQAVEAALKELGS